MEKTNQVYLDDIRQALKKIEKYLKNVDFEVFSREDMRQDAVIRN